MKLVSPLLILLAAAFTAAAQHGLVFDKRNVDCEDRWVAYRPDKDSSYLFGFIYIDEEAGLTFKREGTFKVGPDGRLVAERLAGTSIKARLEPGNARLAIIPASRFAELNIQPVPDWLHFYKTDTATAKRQYRWGYLYNSWDRCGRALDYLKRAYRIDPNYGSVSAELAYTYNCLHQYDSAIALARSALKKHPDDAYLNKEFIYALLEQGQLEAAAKACTAALDLCSDTSYNAENCYNVLHHYYEKEDMPNFRRWLAETKKWMPGGSPIAKNVAAMEERMAR